MAFRQRTWARRIKWHQNRGTLARSAYQRRTNGLKVPTCISVVTPPTHLDIASFATPTAILNVEAFGYRRTLRRSPLLPEYRLPSGTAFDSFGLLTFKGYALHGMSLSFFAGAGTLDSDTCIRSTTSMFTPDVRLLPRPAFQDTSSSFGVSLKNAVLQTSRLAISLEGDRYKRLQIRQGSQASALCSVPAHVFMQCVLQNVVCFSQ